MKLLKKIVASGYPKREALKELQNALNNRLIEVGATTPLNASNRHDIPSGFHGVLVTDATACDLSKADFDLGESVTITCKVGATIVTDGIILISTGLTIAASDNVFPAGSSATFTRTNISGIDFIVTGVTGTVLFDN